MEERQNFARTLSRFMDRAEMILLALLFVGVIGHYMGISQTDFLILIALGGLAGVFFLSAFKPPVGVPQPKEGKKGGFPDLFVQITLPKLMWISCAVCSSSLLMYMQPADNEGYKFGLMIHTTVTMGGLVIIGLGILTGAKQVSTLFPILRRAVPLLLAAVYLLQSDLQKFLGQ